MARNLLQVSRKRDVEESRIDPDELLLRDGHRLLSVLRLIDRLDGAGFPALTGRTLY
jgi:hypothetical protein